MVCPDPYAFGSICLACKFSYTNETLGSTIAMVSSLVHLQKANLNGKTGQRTLLIFTADIGLCLLNKETRERALKVVLSKQFLCSYATLSTFGKFRKLVIINFRLFPRKTVLVQPSRELRKREKLLKLMVSCMSEVRPAKLLRPSSSQQPTQNVKKLDTHPKSDLFSSIKQGVGRATSDVKAESKEHKLNGSL